MTRMLLSNRFSPLVLPLLAMACACLFTTTVPAAPADGASPPAPGRYAARMCVQPLAQPAQPASCGPAEAVVRPGNKAQLRISDIVYRLELNSSQVDVVLMHGTMQIDEFTAFYEWQGATLQFSDREKGMRYEVQFGAPERAAR